MSRRMRLRRAACAALCALLLLPAASASFAQDVDVERSETVYVTADATGEPESVLSSVYLVNPDKRAELTDESSLENVKNLLSNDAPENRDGVWAFQADGEDVCYQGATSAEALPVTMRVRYELDGAVLTPEQIAGRSGHVRITVTYQNKVKSTVTVGAEQVELYTPFSVITMISLDDGFKRVAAENAKLMSEAGNTTVIGTTFPGLAANLDSEPTDSLAESFSFEADVKSFSLESITAIIVPDLLDADDLQSMDDVRDFVDGVDELNDAGDKLTRGARSLHNGAKQFTSGLDAYLEGIGKLRRLADQLKAGLGAADTSGMESALRSAGSDIGTAGDKVGDAGTSAGKAKGKLESLSGLPPEQQAVVDSAIGDLGGALSDIGGAGSALDSAGSTLRGIQGPDLSDLTKGVAGLASGLASLEQNGWGISDGAESLRKGIWKLYKGIREFCDEGLKELDEQTEGMAVSVDRKDAMLELSEAYTAYSSVNVPAGSVKIIITTDSIYVPKVEKAESTAAPAETDAAPAPTLEQPVAATVVERLGEWCTGLFAAIKDWAGSLFK